jgi:hypothetical protein
MGHEAFPLLRNPKKPKIIALLYVYNKQV